MIELKFPPTAPFIAAAVSYLQALTPVSLPQPLTEGGGGAAFDPGVPSVTLGPVVGVGGFGVNPTASSAFSADEDNEEEQPQTTNNVHPAYDGRGFPWDPRIHSGSKALLAKPPHGWKPLRGVDKALVAQVEAELTQSGRTKAAYVEPLETQTHAVPPPPPVVLQAAPPPPPPATFAELMSRLVNANKNVEAQAMLPALGVEAFPQLINHPDKWGQLAAMVGV